MTRTKTTTHLNTLLDARNQVSDATDMVKAILMATLSETHPLSGCVSSEAARKLAEAKQSLFAALRLMEADLMA